MSNTILLSFPSLSSLDFPKLMEVYRESNIENIEEFCPGCEDPEAGRKVVEERFYTYLKDRFFTDPGNCYYVLADGDRWLSAARLFPVPDRKNVFYLEALETRPENRREGWGSELFRKLFELLAVQGDFEITDSVSKNNTASLNLHLSAGFRIFQEESVCVLNGHHNPRAYGLQYIYHKTDQ